jgi:enoyl-[acyl-carrier protein] reductase/trans-2-enoyl-CoA reductase (NAD+)
MKEKNIHEGCIEQMYRLFKKFEDVENLADEHGFIRIDDWEMRDDVQREVADRWEKVNNGNLEVLADLAGYRADFLKLFGFGINSIDYTKDVEIEVEVEENENIINLII